MANFQEVLAQAQVPSRIGLARPRLERDPGAKLITGAIKPEADAYGASLGAQIQQSSRELQGVTLHLLEQQRALDAEKAKQDASNEYMLAYGDVLTDLEARKGRLQGADPKVDPETNTVIPKDVTYVQDYQAEFWDAVNTRRQTMRNKTAVQAFDGKILQLRAHEFPAATQYSNKLFMERDDAEKGENRLRILGRASTEAALEGPDGLIQLTPTEAGDLKDHHVNGIGRYSPKQAQQGYAHDLELLALARAGKLAAAGEFTNPMAWRERLNPNQIEGLRQENEKSLKRQRLDAEAKAKEDEQKLHGYLDAYNGAVRYMDDWALKPNPAQRMTLAELEEWAPVLKLKDDDYRRLRSFIEAPPKRPVDQKLLASLWTKVMNVPPPANFKAYLDHLVTPDANGNQVIDVDTYRPLMNEYQANERRGKEDPGLAMRVNESGKTLEQTFKLPQTLRDAPNAGQIQEDLENAGRQARQDFLAMTLGPQKMDPDEARRIAEARYLPLVDKAYDEKLNSLYRLTPYRNRAQFKAAKFATLEEKDAHYILVEQITELKESKKQIELRRQELAAPVPPGPKRTQTMSTTPPPAAEVPSAGANATAVSPPRAPSRGEIAETLGVLAGAEKMAGRGGVPAEYRNLPRATRKPSAQEAEAAAEATRAAGARAAGEAAIREQREAAAKRRVADTERVGELLRGSR
jgi:hypothetical protein